MPYSIEGVSIGKGEYGLNAPACEYEEGLPKYLRITDIDDDGRYIDNSAYVAHCNSHEFVLRENDLVFARTGASVGKSYLYTKRDGLLVYAGFLIKFAIDPNKCNTYIVKKNCVSAKYQEWVRIMSARSGQPGINAEEYAKYHFMAPKSLTEQSKIAEILMKWDEAIELFDELIEAIEAKRNHIINQITSKKSGWKTYSLVDILEELVEHTTVNDQYEVLSSTKQGLFAQSEYFDKQVASENNVGYKVIRRGNMVLSPQNLWLGNINYNDSFEIGIVSPSYKVFKIKDQFDKTLVSTIMKLPIMLHKYVLSSEQGASVVRRNLNMDLFYQITISLPDLETQQRLGKVITLMGNQIVLYRVKREILNKQRKALQQYLLNGIVRV